MCFLSQFFALITNMIFVLFINNLFIAQIRHLDPNFQAKTLLYFYVTERVLSTSKTRERHVPLERVLLDVYPVKISLLFTTPKYTFGGYQIWQ
jgi:hypothetical protein